MTPQEETILIEATGFALRSWRHPAVVTPHLGKRRDTTYTAEDGTQILITTHTTLDDIVWTKVRGKGVRRVALEDHLSGRVVFHRVLDIKATNFILRYSDHWTVALNPGDPLANLFEVDRKQEQITLRGSCSAALALVQNLF